MSDWQWARTVDRNGIARFVVPDLAAKVARLTLPETAYDLSGSDAGRRRLAQLIYEGLLGWDKHGAPIAYDRPKYNYEKDIQTIRTPEEILNSPNLGTCLDLSLLYAGLCMHYGLLPLVVLLNGHAYVAVNKNHSRTHDKQLGWDAFGRSGLVEIEDGEGLLTDATTLQNLIEQGDYLPVECTGFAYTQKLSDKFPEGHGRLDGYLPFEQAVAAGKAQLDNKKRLFRYAADIHYLQQKGVRPMTQPTKLPAASTPGRSMKIVAKGGSSIDIFGNVALGNITISHMSHGSNNDQEELRQKIAELNDELKKLGEDYRDEAKKLQNRVNKFLEYAKEAEPDKEAVESNGNLVVKAAKKLAEVAKAATTVLPLAEKIVSLVKLMLM